MNLHKKVKRLKILLMEDDRILGETIGEILKEADHDVEWVLNGEDAAERSFENRFDLYVLDINVPEINGLQLLEELRGAGDETPVIYISAMTDIATISRGFTLGADDYIKKPFFPEELLVRIEAKMAKFHHALSVEKITFDPKNHEVKKEGQLISMGEGQLALLQLFIRNLGKTLPKEILFEAMEHPSDTALRVAINKLKNTTEWNIQNVRGIGYRLETR